MFDEQPGLMAVAWRGRYLASWSRPSETGLGIAPSQEFIPVDCGALGHELDWPRHVRAIVKPAADGVDFDAQELGDLLGAQGMFLRS